jgi:hypothetical protein
MENKTFFEAVELHVKINALMMALKALKERTHRLTYYERIDYGVIWSWNEMSEMTLIREILDRHDALIQKEIEEELVKLQNEIARL